MRRVLGFFLVALAVSIGSTIVALRVAGDRPATPATPPAAAAALPPGQGAPARRDPPQQDPPAEHKAPAPVAPPARALDRAALPKSAQFLVDDPYFAAAERRPLAAALARYVGVQQRALERLRAGGEARVVVVNPKAQAGNRLLATASAFLLALLTDRALLVRFHTGYNAGFYDMFAANGLDVESPVKPRGNRVSATLTSQKSRDVARWTELLLCSDLDKALPQPVVEINSHQYFARYLVYNPHYRERLRELFEFEPGMGTSHMFRAVSQFLFRPSAGLQKWVARWAPQDPDACVGVQLRSSGFNGPVMLDWERQVFYDCAQNLTESLDVPQAKRSVFFATDSSESQEHIKEHVRFAKPEMIPFQRSKNVDGVLQAMADAIVAGHCNGGVVVTGWSTFGNLAAAWAQNPQPPMIVTDVRDPPPRKAKSIISYGRFADGFHEEPRPIVPMYMNIPMANEKRPYCMRRKDIEPCFHMFGLWNPAQASCFDPKIIEEEMMGGRWC